MRSRLPLLAAVALLTHAAGAHAACCYFSAKNADILQPAQKVFITWDPQRAEAIYKVIRGRLAKCQKERPFGYLVREAPADDVKNLQQLAGHLSEGLFITKFRKIFARDEMNDDLTLVPARYNGAEDNSEYEELLPVSPP